MHTLLIRIGFDSRTGRWELINVREFLLLHEVFVGIVEKELGHPIPIPQEIREASGQQGAAGDQPATDPCQQWLALLDLGITPHKLRGYIAMKDPEDSTLVALVRFLVFKKPHTEIDRDKLDWLLTHLFKKREERRGTPTGWPRKEIHEILAGVEFPPLGREAEDQLMEVPSLLDEIKYFSSFHQITDSRAVERGRSMKNHFGEDFFHPDVMAAIVNYNLLLGKKFYGLIQEVSDKVHEFAQSGQVETAPNTKELLQDDYRATADAFRDLGEIDRKELPTAPPPPGEEASTTTSLEHQLRQLGVHPEQEALDLRNRIKELSMKFRSNLQTATVPNQVTPVRLQEWETGAFRAKYAEDEETFRAEFARTICHAVGLVSRIYEEIPLYVEKKGTEFHWKAHYDSLVYLLYEGRKHKETILALSASSKQRGLHEKAKQLQLTAEKLSAAVDKAAGVF